MHNKSRLPPGPDHPPEHVNKLKFLSTLRKRAREETTKMHSLYNDQLAQEDDNEIPLLPSFSCVSSALCRQRRNTMPALPRNLSDVDLLGSWTETTDERHFLLLSNGVHNKILAFSTLEQLQILQAADMVYMDGTFTFCPDLWDQVYIFHARAGSTSYPLVFTLLPDRQAATYARLFRLLKTEVQQRLNRPLAATRIQTDFELASIRAEEEEFPQTIIKGCYFHYCQALWRKVQDLGLAVPYKEDPRVKQFIRRAASLALLP
ncbi:uncharacterized protein LOC124135251 [Haliotis rufescens]|uniref:uncharacterized protein LOC124135251 n=1 Tax=Haliotis rufescens TaxID=6454 RepID=UPI00201F536E|nr:uncharacterized protein LOC124135251 [Haliotis rufescens]